MSRRNPARRSQPARWGDCPWSSSGRVRSALSHDLAVRTQTTKCRAGNDQRLRRRWTGRGHDLGEDRAMPKGDIISAGEVKHVKPTVVDGGILLACFDYFGKPVNVLNVESMSEWQEIVRHAEQSA